MPELIQELFGKKLKRVTFGKEYCNMEEDSLAKESGTMRFREEMLSKIFTYITVLVLLGGVAFEAWSLQKERERRSEVETQLVSAEENIQEMVDINGRLNKENADLTVFRDRWKLYASSLGNSEVLSLQTDLFMRTDLIPREALDEVVEAAKREEPEKEEGKQKEDAGRKSAFTFDNPTGDNIFLPVSANSGDGENCLIYTVAYETDGTRKIELLYEVVLDEKGKIARRNKNGEVEWYCIAYQTGEGWKAAKGEE